MHLFKTKKVLWWLKGKGGKKMANRSVWSCRSLLKVWVLNDLVCLNKELRIWSGMGFKLYKTESWEMTTRHMSQIWFMELNAIQVFCVCGASYFQYGGNGKFLEVQLISQILQIYTHTNTIWRQFDVVYTCHLWNSDNMGRAKYLSAGGKENVHHVINQKVEAVFPKC